jgi:cytochrome c-type biogenesis protein CcmH
MKHILWILTLVCLPALAVVEGHKYQFDNQRDQERFTHLAEELRCPKCQNQNLADSNAPVASDMRAKMYDLMVDGKSDQEIVDYIPPMRSQTFLLWFGPLIVFVLGLLVLMWLKRSQKPVVQPLSAAEKAKLDELKKKAGS